MKVSLFDYELPPERIAQAAVEPRDAARLFVHDVAADATEHRLVRDLPRYLRAGDLLVVNDTRVRPARLCGKRASGGGIELLVLETLREPSEGRGARVRAYAKPAKRLRIGEPIELEDGALRATAIERPLGRDGEPGPEWILDIELVHRESIEAPALETLDGWLERFGRMPLPPYIRRGKGADPQRELDRDRYQTVYARSKGAIAAPTAGLHFTPQLLQELDAHGVERACVTLHVGAGTFLPVTADDAEDHEMHSEEFALSEETVDAVHRTRARGGRVIAVGTTSVRVLESCAQPDGVLAAARGRTSIFLRPGSPFHVVDGLLTNFHLPRSTLLMLVAAFAGRERVLALYAEAVRAGYRFYSYGDAMLLFARPDRARA